MHLSNERLTGLSDAKRALLAARLKKTSVVRERTIARRPDSGSVPLSFGQQRLWLIDQLNPGSVVYNMLRAVRLTGPLDPAVLARSLTEMVRRHEVLRTTLPTVEGQPVGQIQPALPVPLPLVDLCHGSAAEREAQAQCRAREEVLRPSDLAGGPLVRAQLLRLGEQEHVLLLLLHHAVMDGWSTSVLVHELAALYNAFAAGRPSPLPELPIQYADYALWQRDALQGEVLQKQVAYWKTKLGGDLPVLDLPTDRPRPPVLTHRAACRSRRLPRSLSAALHELSRAEGVTLFMTLLAALKVLLARSTGQEDIRVGSPIYGRTHVEIEELIGFFVNTLVLRTDLSGQPSFRQLLHRVREVALGAYAHQDVPFEKLVEVLQPTRDLSRAPLYQIAFQVRNFALEAVEAGGLKMELLEYDREVVHTDLDIVLVDQADGLACRFLYNTDLFDSTTIDRLLGHYQTVLEAVVQDPGQPIGALPLLTTAERQQLIVAWNDTRTDCPRDQCVQELFEQQVERSADAVAVRCEDEALTYRQLNRRANQLAHRLRSLGVGPEVLVGIGVERSLEMVVGILGILKAGGAYVPLDPAYPKQRLAFMLQEAPVRVLLTQQCLADRFSQQGMPVICLDTDGEALERERAENLAGAATAENLAYVIYTSGSTGTPKGVMIPHRGLVNYLTWCTQAYAVAAGSGAPVHSSLAFDLTITGLFGPLLVGRCVHLLPETRGIDTLSAAWRARPHFSLVKITPAHLALLSQQLEASEAAAGTHAFIIGGENLTAECVAFWQDAAPATVLINEYGPTETVVGCCVYQVPRRTHRAGSIPIGRPIANTQLYVLDGYGQPVPVGVVGELYIGGAGVARGYLHRPDLTAERFLPDPFSAEPGARLYKTGDLARYLPDGNLEFLGRVDHQVKIRGFRIELGEVEAVLGQHPAVRQVAVVVREDLPGDKRLVAYVAADVVQQPTVAELRSFLKDKLPDYMVPSAYVLLDALPLTPNGKVDRRALPAAEPACGESTQTFVPPRDPVEVQLVQIWEELLHTRPIGVQDDFFALGGHSLLAARLFAHIEKVFGKKLPLAILFQGATIAHLAGRLKATDPSAVRSLVALQPRGALRPIFCVHGIGGEVLCYAELARALGTDQPFYGLQAPRWDPRQGPFPSIEALAAQYVQEIRTVQPEGPYCLGGFSSGGTVAFEMAQQLHAVGQEVALLAILDHACLYARSQGARQTLQLVVPFVRNLFYWCVDDLLHDRPGQLFTRLRLKVRGLLQRGWSRRCQSGPGRGDWNLEGIFDLDSLPPQYRRFLTGHAQALERYVPRRYPGRVTLIRARTRPLLRVRPLDLGWRELAAGGVQVRVIAGSHGTLLKEPYVRALAAQLHECLRQANGASCDWPNDAAPFATALPQRAKVLTHGG